MSFHSAKENYWGTGIKWQRQLIFVHLFSSVHDYEKIKFQISHRFIHAPLVYCHICLATYFEIRTATRWIHMNKKKNHRRQCSCVTPMWRKETHSIINIKYSYIISLTMCLYVCFSWFLIFCTRVCSCSCAHVEVYI